MSSQFHETYTVLSGNLGKLPEVIQVDLCRVINVFMSLNLQVWYIEHIEGSNNGLRSLAERG